ncbi:MAG: ATP-dependent Clp protease proteolytic subunit [Alphaproteobacteria bacterium]|nr:MAG: ATP-dependent Clp protease proteolytic subunit [Alphaproteobacteria bacterium]
MEKKNANLAAVKALFDNLSPTDQDNFLKEQSSSAPSGTVIPTIEEQEPGGVMKRWDLFSRLLSDRIIRLDGEVNGAMASVAQASLQYLNAIDPKKPIRMMINSPGGSVLDGLVIYDTMREIDAPVHTQGYGMMASMGSLLLVGGDKRSASQNSSIMIHAIASGTQGKIQDQEVALENTDRLYKILADIYVAHTGIPEEQVYKLLERDNWLTPEEGQKLNIIDTIIPHKKPAPFAHMVNKGGKPKREKFNETAKKLIDEIYQTRTQGNDNDTANTATSKSTTPANKGPNR